MKIDARIAIQLLCSGEIELIDWNVARMLVPD